MTFDGFVPPTKNYFPMPNNWPDISAGITNLAELKVVEYVLRHTWGYHEYGICKTISVDEFMHGRRRQDGSRMDKGTGLSEQGVRNGLHKAIKEGYLISEVDASDAGRIKKSYALRMQADTRQVQTLDPPQTIDPSTGTKFIPGGSKDYTPGVQDLDLRVPEFIPRTEKDTLERHLGNTPKKESTFDADASTHAQPINFAEKKKSKTDPQLPVVSHSQEVAIGNIEEDISLAETTKHKAVPKGASNASSDYSDLRGDHRIDPAGVRDDASAQRAGETEALEALGRVDRIGDNNGNSELPTVGSSHSDFDRADLHTHRTENAQQQEVASQHSPGAGMDLPLVVTPPRGSQGDATSSQAISSLTDATPAQHSGHSPGTLTSAGAAQVVPKRSRARKPPVYLELTLQGAAVKQWYEEARGTKLRMSSGNVAACNIGGDNEDVTQFSLTETIKHLDELKWVIEHEYAIDIQVLFNDKSHFNFEKNWPLVKRKLALKAKQDERNNGTYSDFDIYVGNGPEERAAALADYEEHRKNGTLAW
jgi:hypothetical protein